MYLRHSFVSDFVHLYLKLSILVCTYVKDRIVISFNNGKLCYIRGLLYLCRTLAILMPL